MSFLTTERHRRWILTLEIAGLPWRYSTGTPTAAPIPGHPGELLYTDVACVSDVGALGDELPLGGGIGRHDAIRMALGRVPGHAGDPLRAFARVGRRSATVVAAVTRTIPRGAEPPFSIEVDGGGAALEDALGLPALISVGQEQFWCSGVDEETDELIVTARGVGGTRPRTHRVEPALSQFPLVTGPEVVFWRGRPATLWAEPHDRSKAPKAVARGFLQRAPKPDRAGHSATLEVVPLTALLDDSKEVEIPGEATTLVANYHEFHRGRADAFELYIRNAYDGGVDTRRISVLADEEDSAILIWPGLSEEEEDSFVGRINAALPGEQAWGVATATRPVVTGLIEGAGDPDAPGGVALALRRADGEDVPEGIGDRYVAAIDGVTGDLTLCNRARWPAPRDPQIATVSVGELYPEWILPGGDPVTDIFDPLGGAGDNIRLEDSSSLSLMWFPIVWDNPAAPTEPRIYTDTAQVFRWDVPVGAVIESHAVARGWYQRGEPAILVEDALDVSEGVVRITSSGPRHLGGPVDIVADVLGIEPVVIPVGPRAGETVYRVTFAAPERVPSFGAWGEGSGMETGLTVRSERSPVFEGPGNALIWLVTNEAGLGLTDDEVDIASFRRIAAPPWTVPFELPPGRVALGDLAHALLRLTRSALAMATDAVGRCRLTRVRTVAEIRAELVATLDASNLGADRQEWDNDDRLVNGVDVKSHWRPDPEANGDGDFTVETQFRDRDSIEAHEGEIQSETVDAFGIAPEPAPVALLPFARSVFRDLAEERRVFRVRVPTYLGALLAPGAVVSITSPRLIGYDGEAVVDGLARVVRRKLDLWREGCDLELQTSTAGSTSGEYGTGWNAALSVTDVSDGVYTVAANAWAPEFNPWTGAAQTDLSYFVSGDAVFCEPLHDADSGSAAALTVVDRGARTVTLDPDPGLAVGDLIVPAAYASGSALHREHAYLSVGRGWV